MKTKTVILRAMTLAVLGSIFTFTFYISAAQAQLVCCDEGGVVHARGDDLEACLVLCPNETGDCLAVESCDQRRASVGEFADDAVEPTPFGEAGPLEFESRVVTPERGATSGGALELPNPLGTSNIFKVVGRIIRVLVSAIGMIGLLMFIYAGFMWLTAAGNPEKIKKGQQILLWVTLGMAIMFTAYFTVRYILLALTTATRDLPPGAL